LSDEECEVLVGAFLSNPAGARYAEDQRAWFLTDAIVDFRCNSQARPPERTE
jgi:hypothetical protein